MYLALYRKYRPRTFDDDISEPEIVTTLKNQIAEGQNAHAYLFTGSRGTGKTTLSLIHIWIYVQLKKYENEIGDANTKLDNMYDANLGYYQELCLLYTSRCV